MCKTLPTSSNFPCYYESNGESASWDSGSSIKLVLPRVRGTQDDFAENGSDWGPCYTTPRPELGPIAPPTGCTKSQKTQGNNIKSSSLILQVCHHCGEYGHVAKDCPRRNIRTADEVKWGTFMDIVMDIFKIMEDQLKVYKEAAMPQQFLPRFHESMAVIGSRDVKRRH